MGEVSDVLSLRDVLPIVAKHLSLGSFVRLSFVAKEYLERIQNNAMLSDIDLRHCTNCVTVLACLSATQLTGFGSCIRHISFEFNPSVSDEAMKFLPTSTKFTSLNLNGCQQITDLGLEYVAERCRFLSVVECYWNTNISGAAISKILQSCGSNILKVNLSGCQSVTDDALKTLVKFCPNTVYLDITRCVKVTEVGLSLACEKLGKIDTLILYACHHLQPVVFKSIRNLNLLTQLDLCGALVKDAQMEAICDRCHLLQKLNLTWCLNLTDKSLECIAAGCHQLIWLSMHGNRSITSKGELPNLANFVARPIHVTSGLEVLSQSPCAPLLRAVDFRGCFSLQLTDQETVLRGYFINATVFALHS